MPVISLILKSSLLGFGLAMDAFSVSVANGIANPKMRKRKGYLIAGTFAFFQLLMPLIGWAAIDFIKERFAILDKCIPWAAFILLGFIGGKMIVEAIKEGKEEKEDSRNSDGDSGESAELGTSASDTAKEVTFKALIVQGIATSIDALSVGFTIADYGVLEALSSALIIGIVTFVICIIGLFLGKKLGQKLANRATIVGGIVLIAIGIEILVKGLFF